MTKTPKEELSPRDLFADLTIKRVHSAYVCPVCRYDNRKRGDHCVHYVCRAEGREAIPLPPIGGRHVLAQSWSNPSDPALLTRYVVYEEH